MKAKHARLIREGIRQAKQFEAIIDPAKRYETVYGWARGMYAYTYVGQSSSAFLICQAMLSYTRRQITK